MTEHLFKLKKDGKTVGYLKIDRGLICWRHTTLSAVLNETWYTVHNSARIDFDTAHPFITKDKKGKDVFADDEVSFLCPNGEYTKTSKVEWDNGGFVVAADTDYFPYIGECYDIELIEDKE